MAKGKAVQAARIIRDRLAGRCPVTGGCVTRMTKKSFLRVCGRHQEQARKNVGKAGWGRRGAEQYCLECQGKHLPRELEIICMEVNMPVNGEEIRCDCCGEKKRLKKVHGYLACATCEHLVRGVRNRPEVIRRLWGDIHGYGIGGNEDGLAEEIRQALKVPGDVAADELPGLISDLMQERGQYAAELDGVRKALDAAVDEDLIEVATLMVDELREARSTEAVLEEKSAPADHVSVSRLLSDRDLLASINTLSDALRN